MERTYALSLQDAEFGAEDLGAMTPEDHRRAFVTFLAGLLGDVDRYTGSADVDLERDGAGYHTVGLGSPGTSSARWSPRSLAPCRPGRGTDPGRAGPAGC